MNQSEGMAVLPEKNFESGSHSLLELFGDTGRDNWGVRIPNYQRNYKWKSSDQISRLQSSIYSNFSTTLAPTFLGSIIFAEQSRTSAHKHIPIDVVDGQQRLTTLTLFSLALIVKLAEQKQKINGMPSLTPDDKDWLQNELNRSIEDLESFVFITITVQRISSLLPRLFRTEDDLQENQTSSQFKSPLASAVLELAKTEPSDYPKFEFPKAIKDSNEGELIYNVYADFGAFIDKLSDEESLEKDESCEFVPITKLSQGNYTRLFTADGHKCEPGVFKNAKRNDALADLLRILLLSGIYF